MRIDLFIHVKANKQMTKIEKIKYSSHTYMFFDGELFENFVKEKKKIEELKELSENEIGELTRNESFYQFNEPQIGFEATNEYYTQTHGTRLGYDKPNIHAKGDSIIEELFISTTNFDDTNFSDAMKYIQLPSQTKINHSSGKINIHSKELVIYDNRKTSIKFKVPNGIHKIVELYDDSYVQNIKRERLFEKAYQDAYEGKYPKEKIKLYKAIDKNMKTNFLHPSFEEDLVQGITEDIYGEWDTWKPTPPNLHMLYINFLSEQIN